MASFNDDAILDEIVFKKKYIFSYSWEVHKYFWIKEFKLGYPKMKYKVRKGWVMLEI